MRGHSTFEGYEIARTARAILFQGHYWEGPLFFPLSQIQIEQDGDMGMVVHVKDWLVGKRGILEFTHYSKEDVERIAAT